MGSDNTARGALYAVADYLPHVAGVALVLILAASCTMF